MMMLAVYNTFHWYVARVLPEAGDTGFRVDTSNVVGYLHGRIDLSKTRFHVAFVSILMRVLESGPG
jgi:DNA helicase IV